MKLLAIESSALTASVCIYEDGIAKALYSTNFKKTHSQTLMPMVSEIIEMTQTDLESIDAIAVSAGPGSFTGLRIGSACAKGLCLALDKPLIHVPTLDAMAYNFYGSRDLIVPVMDARRSQVYTGIYTFENTCGAENLKILLKSCAMDIKDLLVFIKENYFKTADETACFFRVIFLGDGVLAFKDIIVKEAKFEFMLAQGANAFQSASSLAQLAGQYYIEGKIINADDESPDYLRPSQAERVKAEKEKNARS